MRLFVRHAGRGSCCWCAGTGDTEVVTAFFRKSDDEIVGSHRVLVYLGEQLFLRPIPPRSVCGSQCRSLCWSLSVSCSVHLLARAQLLPLDPNLSLHPSPAVPL